MDSERLVDTESEVVAELPEEDIVFGCIRQCIEFSFCAFDAQWIGPPRYMNTIPSVVESEMQNS